MAVGIMSGTKEDIVWWGSRTTKFGEAGVRSPFTSCFLPTLSVGFFEPSLTLTPG